MIESRVPLSTYRVQFNKDFRFVDARDLVPYLHALGIGDLYSSPRFRSQRGSSHGYDVTDAAAVNSELGTDEEFDDLCAKLRTYGMGLLLDVVPNHMAASHENPWWTDVMENGPASPYARYFDIDWHPATTKAAFLQQNRVLVPVLGDFYGNVLERGEFTIHLDEAGLFLRYFERRFPLDPGSYDPILEQCMERLSADLGADHASLEVMGQIRALVWQVPPRTSSEPADILNRQALAKRIKQQLFALYRDHVDVRLSIDAALAQVGGNPADNRSFDLLDRILNEQGWRLAHWKIAFEEINYRRFFDINDLVSLRVEDEEVFEARHAAVIELVRDGKVTGLRVDHLDGLHDPGQYLSRLQQALCAATQQRRFFVVVEKILGRDEPLAPEWSACGTTGYDFLNVLNDVFIDPGGLRAMESTYSDFTGETGAFAELCYSRNKQVMWKLFAGEVHALGHDLGRLAAEDRHARDVPLSELVNALVETTACLPVYRTYIHDFKIAAKDRQYLERTLKLARDRCSETDVSSQAFHFLRRVLLLDPPEYAAERRGEWLSFIMRWQKFTGPVMAKGLEDTAFYVHHSLISRNEVGGDPLREKDPHSRAEFHAFLRSRQQNWPDTLNATTTHDTKRSEDVRARINVLSEISSEWREHLLRWSLSNRDKKANAQTAPTPSEEVLIYQTLIGAWPLDPQEVAEFVNRVKNFIMKALREGKTNSGWLEPDEAYEDSLRGFVERILSPSGPNPFLADFLPFVSRIAYHGSLNSLSQVLIKITSPGVPDLYQGTELWDFSLVDPDNRRPVDFRNRVSALERIRAQPRDDVPAMLAEIVASWRDGRIKLYLTDKALDVRHAQASLFQEGECVPLDVSGPDQDSVLAFARRKDDVWSITIAIRWTMRLRLFEERITRDSWEGTSVVLPESAPRTWRDVFTGELTAVSLSESGPKLLHLHDVLRNFPVGLLVNVQNGSGQSFN